jgi:hypothetical protein
MKAPSTGETLLIRRYRPEDREIVLRLLEIGLRETGTFVEGWDLDEDLLDIEGSYLNDSGEFFVGLLADRIVAIGALRGIAPGRAEIKRHHRATAGCPAPVYQERLSRSASRSNGALRVRIL